MGSANQYSTLEYSTLVHLGNNGKTQSIDQPQLRNFLAEHFGDVLIKDPFPDLDLQKQLIALMRDPKTSPHLQILAEQCLRCRISHKIYQTISVLWQKFRAGMFPFELSEILYLVLDDTDRKLKPFNVITSDESKQYKPLAQKILESYRFVAKETKKSEFVSLNVWVDRLVRHHTDITRFLLNHGIALISDWALLNETTISRMERLLREKGIDAIDCSNEIQKTDFINHACDLLRAYHQVYRRDRTPGTRCKALTDEQLKRIVDLVEEKLPKLKQTDLMDNYRKNLGKLATRLREHYIQSRGGAVPLSLLPQDDKVGAVGSDEHKPEEKENKEENKEEDFELTKNTQILVDELSSTRQSVFPEALDRTVAEFIEQRYQGFAQSQRKGIPEKAPHYWKALHLYFQEFQSLTEIAPQVGMRGQDNVTNLLVLKPMRLTVRRLILNNILKAMQQTIRQFPLETHEDLDQAITQIQKWLDSPELPSDLPRLDMIAEPIDQVFTEEARRSMDSRNRARSNLFTQSVCRHIQTHPDRYT